MSKATITPFRVPRGPIKGEDLEFILSGFVRDILARMDIRNDRSAFAAALLANEDTGVVTVGSGAQPTGRSVGLPVLTSLVSNAGRAIDYRFLQAVSTANHNSVQSIDAILTATSNASTSTISVASHNVRHAGSAGAVVVPYTSGSVTGLTTSTVYYVYADDPDYAGGAVTWLATTNPDNLIAIGRYYVGAITTPVAATAGSVSAATSANPIEITTGVAHGYLNGNTVTFATMGGDFGTNLNGQNFVITYVNTTKFTIAVNGIGYAAYGGGGTVTRVSTSSSGGGGAGGGSGGGRWAIP